MMRFRPTVEANRTPDTRRGFTLIELIVSMALLTAVMVMVSQIFKITTDASTQTKAQSEVFARAAAFRQMVTDLLSKIEPGFLAIDCPRPTTVHAEHLGGPSLYRLRHDAIVFVASGRSDEFQSFADPGDPSRPPVTSSQALVYFGSGITRLTGSALMNSNQFVDDQSIPADEWILSHRALLIGVPDLASEAVMLNDFIQSNGNVIPLDFRIRTGEIDIINLINADTLMARLGKVNILNNNLWDLNYTPPTATMGDRAWAVNPDHYTRSGFNFAPHVADLRIDWTDGRSIDPNPVPNQAVYQTRWFGLRPDHTSIYSDPGSIGYRAHMRSQFDPNTDNPIRFNEVNPPSERNTVDLIEVSNGGTNPTSQNTYRAMWQSDTWGVRPKALRFTFRVFDRNGKLSNNETLDLNEDGLPDDFSSIDGSPDIVRRYGKEFSFIVPLS